MEGQISQTAEAGVASGSRGAPAPAEPRSEIWFKRRVRLGSAMRELWAFRELVLTLAERDLRVRYKQAVLGIAWALITPVAMMIAFTLIFTKVGHLNAQTHGAPYAIFSYVGLIAWTFFSTSVSTGGLSLVQNVSLLNKLYCPREVFPIAAMIDAAVDSTIATFVLLLLFPIYGYAPRMTTLYTPLLLLVLLIFSLGVTFAVSAVVVFMRDLRLVLPLVIQLGLFVTPVMYPTSSLIHSSRALVLVYSAINPLAPVMDGLRRGILWGQAPDWAALGVGSISALLVLLAGFMLFKRLETGIADVA